MRLESGAVCGRIACSTVWKTPTSELVALIVPVNAARMSTMKLLVTANTIPPRAMSSAIVATVRRRPYRSAMIDQKIVISAEPAMAAVKTTPISVGVRPRRSRYRPSAVAR